MNRMRSLLFLFLSLLLVAPSLAQQPDVFMGSSQRPIKITLGTVYQQYSDEDRQLSQVAFPFRAFIPVANGVGISLLTTPVLINADSLVSVNGLSDAQIAISYFRDVGPGSVVLSLSSNLPSGKRELTEDEFATMALLSQDFYSFGVPVLGQGLNLAPALTFAYPINNNVVVGAGASYQMKGDFKPVQDMVDSFTPGDELMITGGVDVRVGRSWAVSTSFSYIMYQEDELGGESIFESGDQAFVSVQLLGNLGTNQLKVATRYRSKAKSLIPISRTDLNASPTSTDELPAFTTAPRTVPQQMQLSASYRMRIQDGIQATILGRAGYYDETDFFTEKTRFDVGAIQEYSFTESVGAALRFIYTFGSFPGVEVGGGLVVTI